MGVDIRRCLLPTPDESPHQQSPAQISRTTTRNRNENSHLRFSITTVKMKFSFAALLAVVPAVLAGTPGKLSYDPVYGNAGQSTLTLACSDGDNGLYTKGYKTLGDLPKFPMVAAVPDVQGMLSMDTPKAVGHVINR